MKEIFFKGVVVALPLLVIGGLVYTVLHGFYSLYADMQLKKELEEIARQSAARRRERPPVREKKATPEDMFH